MAEIYLEKFEDGRMLPADGESATKWSKAKVGVYRFEFKRERNPQFHKKYFKMVNSAFRNQDRFRSVDDLRKAICFAMGFTDDFQRLSGEIVKVPKSIAFGKMNADEFESLYSATVDALLQYFDLGEAWETMVLSFT